MNKLRIVVKPEPEATFKSADGKREHAMLVRVYSVDSDGTISFRGIVDPDLLWTGNEYSLERAAYEVLCDNGGTATYELKAISYERRSNEDL